MNHNYNQEQQTGDNRILGPLKIVRTKNQVISNKSPKSILTAQSPQSEIKSFGQNSFLESQDNKSPRNFISSLKVIPLNKSPLKLPLNKLNGSPRRLFEPLNNNQKQKESIKRIVVQSSKEIQYDKKSKSPARKIFLAPKKNISIICTDNESESSSVIWDDTEMRSKGVNDKINQMDTMNAFCNLFKFRYETFPNQREKLDEEKLLKYINKLRFTVKGNKQEKNLVDSDISIINEDFSDKQDEHRQCQDSLQLCHLN